MSIVKISDEAEIGSKLLETVASGGDLSKLNPAERGEYVVALCRSMGLNPLSRPIELISLSGRTVPYCKRDACDQLRKLHGISVQIVSRETVDGVLTVTARAKDANGREDEDVGSVVVTGLKGEALANAGMKAVTKAKRRVTLSICGLGLLDESELDTVPGVRAPVSAPVLAAPVDVIEQTDEERAAEWQVRFAACNSVEELKRVAQEFKAQPASELLRMQVSKAYQEAAARLKGAA